MEYKIEKGIEIPEFKKGVREKYPLSEMEIGDSFFLKPKDGEDIGSFRNRVYSITARHKQRHNKIYTTRTVDGGIRVWRIQ